MASCDFLLAAGIAADCSNPQVAGLEADGILINRADVDWASCSRASANPNIIEDLVLLSGKTGFPVKQIGTQPFSGSNTAFVAGTFRNKYNKTVNLLVYDHSPTSAYKVVDQIANGEFVAILKNKYAGSDSKARYEVFGFEAGLRQTEGSRDPYSEDTDGAWQITLTETGAPTSGLFLFDTDAATTDAAYASLLPSS